MQAPLEGESGSSCQGVVAWDSLPETCCQGLVARDSLPGGGEGIAGPSIGPGKGKDRWGVE